MWDQDRWERISTWCDAELGAPPKRELFAKWQASLVVGVELLDGRSVVVKTRRDEGGRAASCVAVQTALADRGQFCARPLGRVTFADGEATHAEEWLPGGTIRPVDDADAAADFGALFARMQEQIGRLASAVTPPLPNPSWVRWAEPTRFPRLWWHEWWVEGAPLPDVITGTADRVRARLAGCELTPTLGHADWETQNIRWDGRSPYLIHDWDSLAYLPEAALVGVASGMFANNRRPTLAPVECSSVFIDAYESGRRRCFSREEREVAWAASLWPAVYNARTQVLYDQDPIALRALEQQADQRLALASA